MWLIFQYISRIGVENNWYWMGKHRYQLLDGSVMDNPASSVLAKLNNVIKNLPFIVIYRSTKGPYILQEYIFGISKKVLLKRN